MCKLNRLQELPSVDMFVTTVDPVLEPPIITVNTVLSLMAVDYPANKLACYVSDGCSPLNYYALVEASKEEYKLLSRNIEDAAKKSAALGFDLSGYVDDDDYDELLKQLGNSNEFIKSAGHALRGETGLPMNPSNSLDVAHQVAGSAYENGSSWGEKVGWLYGSATEDILTGLMIHTRGWRSGYCNPDPPGFLGCAPSSVLAAMIQQKRWITGQLEILFSKNNPISATLTANLQIRMCIAYLYVIIWGLRSIPELCYAALPAYCIITNTNFLPKVSANFNRI
ncbi:hypothetical protein LWI28_027309 [Acer negundo]|uniref:Cellulose synthase n=1 Tax=Acer negundo TaxID=4023 RepID=A0AAD5IWQ3_ACENE|nr:hypothetical protein LWI28_027309 [Acer negundo]